MLRGNVHVIDVRVGSTSINSSLITGDDTLCVCKCAVFVQRFVSLSNDVARPPRPRSYRRPHRSPLPVSLSIFLIRRLNKAVFVDSCEGCKIGDQTDVRTFRGLDRAHAAVVACSERHEPRSSHGHGKGRPGPERKDGVLCVSSASGFVWSMNWDSGEEPKNSLIAATTGRILIRDCGVSDFHILRLQRHAFADNSLHAGKADAELVLQQLADGTDTAVAELVDIVRKAEADSKAGHVVDGGENIINDDVVRDQLVMTCGELLFELLFVVAALLRESRRALRSAHAR